MTLYEFTIIVLALATLAVLRFGVPALIMWVLSILSHRYISA